MDNNDPEFTLYKQAIKEYNQYKKLHIIRLNLPLFIRLLIISYM